MGDVATGIERLLGYSGDEDEAHVASLAIADALFVLRKIPEANADTIVSLAKVMR